MKRLCTTILTAVLMAGLLAACGDEKPEPKPTPTPAWMKDYSEEQLAEYEKALARWTEYKEKAALIWAEGKVTKDAYTLFKEYWVNPQTEQARLMDAEKYGVKTTGSAKVYWSQATVIQADRKNGGRVRIEQCLDKGTSKTTIEADATPVPQPDKPHLFWITLLRNPSGEYKVFAAVAYDNSEKTTPCDP